MAKGYKTVAVRYLLLATHYRQQLNFTFQGLEAANAAVARLNDFINMLNHVKVKGKLRNEIRSLTEKYVKEFETAMDDDLNMSKALASVFELVKAVYKFNDEQGLTVKDAEHIKSVMLKLNSVLGVITFADMVLDREIERLIQERELARKNKDYAMADEIRDKLLKQGIILEDTAKGVIWKHA